MKLTDRELATVLAALRNWQADALNEDMKQEFRDYFVEHAPLNDNEIDDLCERLCCDD
jgi:hypothetical protein